MLTGVGQSRRDANGEQKGGTSGGSNECLRGHQCGRADSEVPEGPKGR